MLVSTHEGDRTSEIRLNEYRPHYIKYMGSKAKIIDFVVDGLREVHYGGPVCDLFAGSAILSAAIGDSVPLISNDIQAYSGTLARAYLNSWRAPGLPSAAELVREATKITRRTLQQIPTGLNYEAVNSRKAFVDLEKRQLELIDSTFSHRWHLFAKYYSGTWWSAEQCVWIDAFRQVAERYKDQAFYDLLLACLMHAMAYTSQGTGHYAQFRDATTEHAMADIRIYRTRSLSSYFVKKYDSITANLRTEPPAFPHEVSNLDYKGRLDTLPKCTVYADPPYCFVHYSRFYHAIETLVRYDFPQIQVKGGKVVKGRYREDRHQSPFSIRSQVPNAFRELFVGVAQSESNLVLSYSNTGMITLEQLWEIAEASLNGYKISGYTLDHQHMTMGRRKDRHREVEECLLLARLT